MTIQAEITTENQAAWDRLPSALAGCTRQAREEFLREAAGHAQRVAERGAPGSVARSMASQVRSFSARVYVVHAKTHMAKANTLETGRRPGEAMPPIQAIEEWADARGLREAAFVIARAIRRRGMKGRFYMRAALQSTMAAAPAMLNRMGKRVEAAFQERAS